MTVTDPTPTGSLTAPRDLLESLVDPDPCSIDHDGDCQAHMYFGMTPGEVCPQEQLKAILAANPETLS
jgi:hypothetical protein